jgi:hypothetical protein
MKEKLKGRGTNSISKFDHHDVNGGADTIHDVTGRSLGRAIYL